MLVFFPCFICLSLIFINFTHIISIDAHHQIEIINAINIVSSFFFISNNGVEQHSKRKKKKCPFEYFLIKRKVM